MLDRGGEDSEFDVTMVLNDFPMLHLASAYNNPGLAKRVLIRAENEGVLDKVISSKDHLGRNALHVARDIEVSSRSRAYGRYLS